MRSFTTSKAIGLAAALIISGATASTVFAEPMQFAQAEKHKGDRGGHGGGPPPGRAPSGGAPHISAPHISAPAAPRGPAMQAAPRFDRAPTMERTQRFERFNRAPVMTQDRIIQRRNVQVDRRVFDRNLRYDRYHRGAFIGYNRYSYRHRYPFVYLGGPRIIVRGYGPGWCRGLHRGYHWAPRIRWHWGRHYGLYRCW